MIPVFAGEKVAEKGIIVFPAQNGQASYVLREELAEAAAHILATDGHQNKLYQLTSTDSVSFSDIAGELSRVLGKEVTYQSPPVEEFEAMLKSLGVPDQYIGMFITWATALSQQTMDADDRSSDSSPKSKVLHWDSEQNRPDILMKFIIWAMN